VNDSVNWEANSGLVDPDLVPSILEDVLYMMRTKYVWLAREQVLLVVHAYAYCTSSSFIIHYWAACNRFSASSKLTTSQIALRY